MIASVIVEGALCESIMVLCHDESVPLHEVIATAQGLVGRELTDDELDAIFEESSK